MISDLRFWIFDFEFAIFDLRLNLQSTIVNSLI
jgi:hypothetical protein